MSELPDTPWTMTILMGIAGVCLVGLGLLLGLFYCEYRQTQQLQELTHLAQGVTTIGETCIGNLVEMNRVAVVLARTQPRPGPLSPVARDSAREARWTHQP